MVYQTPSLQKTKGSGHYSGKTIVLSTKHRKAEALARPLNAGIGACLQTIEIDTDKLGTFTGEVERQGTPLETAVRKARLGMSKTSSSLGLATEGSFGPHPSMPFVAGCQEIIVLVDEELGIQISESVVSAKTNYGHIQACSIEEAETFFSKAKFPSHGLIVRPNKHESSLLGRISRAVSGKPVAEPIYKGIQDRASLEAAIVACRKLSRDGMARIETDMRAHMNPTRMRILRSLGIKLSRRLRNVCRECECPGFGLCGGEGFLCCEECGYPSDAPALEVHMCARCNYKESLPRADGITHVEAMYCQRCNP